MHFKVLFYISFSSAALTNEKVNIFHQQHQISKAAMSQNVLLLASSSSINCKQSSKKGSGQSMMWYV